MKKIIFTVLIMLIILTLASCNKAADEKNEVTNEDMNQATDEVTNEDMNQSTDEVTEDTNQSTDEVTEDTNQSTDEVTNDSNLNETEDPSDETSTGNSQGNLEAIISETYTATGLEFPRLVNTPLTKENQSYMLGVDNFDFLEGYASEPLMSSQAHSVVLFTVAEDADIEGIKAAIKANVDGRKWICVGVEPENIIVDNVSNMIILIMDEQSQAIHEAFLASVN